MKTRGNGEIKCNTNLWHQKTPHRSCQQIPVRYSADTNERRCAFVMNLSVGKREEKNEAFQTGRMTDRVVPLITEVEDG